MGNNNDNTYATPHHLKSYFLPYYTHFVKFKTTKPEIHSRHVTFIDEKEEKETKGRKKIGKKNNILKYVYMPMPAYFLTNNRTQAFIESNVKKENTREKGYKVNILQIYKNQSSYQFMLKIKCFVIL